MKEKNVLMCGSKLEVKGGMVSVIKNYLAYENWDEVAVTYVPTHIEKSKILVLIYFVYAYIKIIVMALMGKIDVAYLHTAEKGSFFRKAILVSTLKKFGVKTIMHHHAAEFEEFYANLSDKWKKYVNEILEKVDLNIVLSERLVSMITDKQPKANVKVLYNAVNTYETNPYNNESKKILFLGRLGKRKGAYDLLNAIKILNDKIDPEVQFCLCGDGEVEEIKAKVDELGIRNRIAHIGWIDGEQKKKLLAQTLINILPSYNEGLPMSILETMAYGIPNISTNIASIPEVIKSGETGYLIEPGDVDGIVKLVEMLVIDSKLRREISEKSWELINQEFSLKNHMKKVKEYIHSV